MKKKLLLFFTTLFCLQNIFSQNLPDQYKNQMPDYGCVAKYIGKYKKFAVEYNAAEWVCDTFKQHLKLGWDVSFTSTTHNLNILYEESPFKMSVDWLKQFTKKQFETFGRVKYYNSYFDTINNLPLNIYELALDTNSITYYYLGAIYTSANATFQILASTIDSSVLIDKKLIPDFFAGLTTDISTSLHSKNFSNQTKTDTLDEALHSIIVMPDIFEAAFMDGTNEKQDGINYKFSAIQIGKIKIETGKIVACDIIGMLDHEPFLQDFPVGEFPLQLAIANTTNDKRIAFSRIKFCDEPVAKWQLAIKKGQQQLPLYGKTFYGYGVDAGVGMFLDEQACKVFNNISDSNPCIQNIMFQEMDRINPATCGYVIFNFGDHNLACFSSGYGDGTYATYIGYDSSGKPCRLLTDFGIIDWVKKKRK